MFAISTAGLCAALYGLGQYYGYDYFKWNESAEITRRVTSTVGQPNLLASFLIISLSASVYSAFASRRLAMRLFWLASAAVQALCLIYTYSRAGIIGLGFSALIAVLMYLGRKWLLWKSFISDPAEKSDNFNIKNGQVNDQYRKKPVSGRIRIKNFLNLIIIGAIAVYLVNFIAESGYYRKKFDFKKDINSGSAGLRIDYLKDGFSTFLKRPLLGYGQDSQSEIYYPTYKKEWAGKSFINSVPDRAHNIILDTLLTTGLLGLLVKIGILAYACIILLGNIRQGHDPALSIFILSAGGGYLASLMFGFESLSGQIAFWSLGGIAFATGDDRLPGGRKMPYQAKETESKKNDRKPVHSRKLIGIPILALLIVYSAYCFWFSIKQYQADYFFREIQIQRKFGKMLTAVELYSYIAELHVFDRYYNEQFGIMLSDWPGRQDTKVSQYLSDRALDAIDGKLAERDSKEKYAKAKVASALCQSGRQEKCRYAIEKFSELIMISPEMPNNHIALGNTYIRTADFKQAVIAYENALGMIPDIDDPAINKMHQDAIRPELFQAYYGLLVACDRLEDRQKLLEYSNKLRSLYPGDMNIEKMMINFTNGDRS